MTTLTLFDAAGVHASEAPERAALATQSRTRLAARLADLAVAALIDEATLTPKPGLVDLRGDGEDTARLNALLALIAGLDDTCLLARGGRAGLMAAQDGARRVLAAGGAARAHGQRALRRLEREMLARRLSPGGAADLLAAALLLDRLAPTSEMENSIWKH